MTPDLYSRWAANAHRYAHKFAAETVCYEPPAWVEPTDEAFAECFKHCVRVPPAEVYPLIREAFLAGYGELRSTLVPEQAMPIEGMLPGMEDAA